jgi:hypothetical protein
MGEYPKCGHGTINNPLALFQVPWYLPSRGSILSNEKPIAVSGSFGQLLVRETLLARRKTMAAEVP